MEKVKLLYVDDEKINLELFTLHLMTKYEIITAEGAEIGLKMIDQNADLKVVISDMRMPKMSGIEFISKAKKKQPDIDYYILTGYEISDEIQNALDQGLIQQYFKKPFNIDEIDHIIQKNI